MVLCLKARGFCYLSLSCLDIFATSLAVLTFLLVIPISIGAEEPPLQPGYHTDLSGQFVDSMSQLIRMDAEADAHQKITGHLLSTINPGPTSLSALRSLLGTGNDLKEVSTELLMEVDEALIDSLRQFTREQREAENDLLREWKQVRREIHRHDVEWFNVEASKRFAGQVAILMSVDNRWLWLSGLLAMGTLAVVAIHDRRHEMRRWLNGGKAKSLGLSQFFAASVILIALVTVGIFSFGDRLVSALNNASVGEGLSILQKRKDELQITHAKLAAAKSRAFEAKSQFEKALEQASATLHTYATIAPKLLEQWKQVIEHTQQAYASLQVAGKLGEQLQGDVAELQDLQNKIAGSAEEVSRYHAGRRYIGTGLALAFLGAVSVGGALFQRGVRRRRERVGSTCPLCLGESTFVALGSESGRAVPGLEMLQCKNVVSEQPYEQCEFTFASMYRDVTKLCFPTLGIPQAGKTHWLAMVYRELNRGNYPNAIQFERIKSSSSEDFDLVVEELLSRKIGPAATQTARIPHPLVFNFLDRDRLGVSDILVNIFDYSGEVIRSQTLEDRQRQRALDGDGFFFFLDPTEPSETQSEALAGFREDLRRIKGVKAGGQIRIPVALCVSKIDLMINEPYADPNGGGVVANFYHDLGKVGWSLDSKSIRARSHLVARLRDTIWPGWQIERQIHELFGGRYMFFPLSPVGLDGVGEADLARRTIAPVGLLDPLLWLLHMNGYPVLP